MGCFTSKGSDSKPALSEPSDNAARKEPPPKEEKDKAIDRTQSSNQDSPFASQQAESQTVKIALLGPGESGKSTIFKQMKLIHDGRRNVEERRTLTPTVHASILLNGKALAFATIQKRPQAETDLLREVSQLDLSTTQWSPELGSKIARVWEHPDARQVYELERGDVPLLSDGAGFLFDNLERISKQDYVPTDEDLLRVRIRTTGYNVANFKYKDFTFCVWDVGGQRSERRHWRACVSGATGMIFVTSLAEYDQLLREDVSRPRMEETLKLWETICNSSHMRGKALVLFLNKADIFRDKVGKKSIRCYFTEYEGRDTFEEASEYIKKRFLDLLQTESDRRVYAHVVSAVDTNNVRLVWNDIRELLLAKAAQQVLNAL